jgi:hypothetical protein
MTRKQRARYEEQTRLRVLTAMLHLSDSADRQRAARLLAENPCRHEWQHGYCEICFEREQPSGPLVF